MPSGRDALYNLFEQYLYSALVENESNEELIARVARDYLVELKQVGFIPQPQLSIVQADIEEEVTEMLRKKTYGSYNVASFRKSSLGASKSDHLNGSKTPSADPTNTESSQPKKVAREKNRA